MTFTIATRPHRRRNSTRRFLAITTPSAVEVDGVTIIGARGEWSVDAAGYRISLHESDSPFWWLHGADIDPVEVIDPPDAIAVLRRRGLLPARCA